jgi:hypothetical protein
MCTLFAENRTPDKSREVQPYLSEPQLDESKGSCKKIALEATTIVNDAEAYNNVQSNLIQNTRFCDPSFKVKQNQTGGNNSLSDGIRLALNTNEFSNLPNRGSVLARCPYCTGPLTSGICEKDGKICESCGTPYKDAQCPSCSLAAQPQTSSQVRSSKSRTLSKNVGLDCGELAPTRREFSQIVVDHPFLSKREADMMRSLFVDQKGKRIHDKASAAVRCMNLSRDAELTLLQKVERIASIWVAKRSKKKKKRTTEHERTEEEDGEEERRRRSNNNNHGYSSRAALEDKVAYVLLNEARQLGKSILEVQDALAKAGFNISLALFHLKITPTVGDLGSVRMYVNGWERPFLPKEAGIGPLGRQYTINVHAYLADALDAGEWMEIRFENAIVLPDEPALLAGKKNSSVERGWHRQDGQTNDQQTTTTTRSRVSNGKKTKKGTFVNAVQNDAHTLSVRLNPTKCFSLFKAIKAIVLDSEEGGEEKDEKLVAASADVEKGERIDTVEFNSDATYCSPSSSSPPPQPTLKKSDYYYLGRFVLPSKKFFASANLMQKALCLGKVERRCAEIFSNSIRNSNGRSPRTLAMDALLSADQEVYSFLPQRLKLAVNSFICTLPLSPSDRSYTGVKGLLIPSELKRDR